MYACNWSVQKQQNPLSGACGKAEITWLVTWYWLPVKKQHLPQLTQHTKLVKHCFNRHHT